MGAIADKLAGVLRSVGRPMILRRYTLGPSSQKIPLDVTVYGTTDGATISRIIGSITQTGAHVIFSDAEIAAAQWPGPPKSGDTIVIDGLPKTLDGNPELKFKGSEFLVYLCQVTG